MQSLADAADSTPDDAVAFIAQLIRLQRQVREISRQLDRIEVEMHEALNDASRERFEGYR